MSDYAKIVCYDCGQALRYSCSGSNIRVMPCQKCIGISKKVQKELEKNAERDQLKLKLS